MQNVIGKEVIYIGDEKRYGGYGTKMRITGVFRSNEHCDSKNAFVTDNEHLSRLGGIRPGDSLEVICWNWKMHRWSFIRDEISQSSLNIK